MELTEKRGLPGSVLKWIAIITMLIDHVCVVLVLGWAKYRHAWGPGIQSKEFYYFLRGIGRISFPIFCFLLVEGFFHTRSRWKYLLRLFVFALISEIPFDLAFQVDLSYWGPFFELKDQNVFFTLTFGLLAVMLWDRLTLGNSPGCGVWRGLAAIACSIALGAAAYYLKTDYGAMGVALVVVLYLLHDRPWERDLFAAGALAAMIPFGSHWVELFGALAFPLFHLYNGQRGRQMKYLFYLFYPVHLILLAWIARRLFLA